MSGISTQLKHDGKGIKRRHNELFSSHESVNDNYFSQEQESHMDMSNISISTTLIINLQDNNYYCCVYYLETCKLVFLEEIRFIKNDVTLLENLLQQFHPDLLICSNKAKMGLFLNKSDNDDIKIEVKPSKDFNVAEGELFLDSLERGFLRKDASFIRDNILRFISRLKNMYANSGYVSNIKL